MSRIMNQIKFFDILKTKFYNMLFLCYQLDKQTDKTIYGFKHQFQKNKD